MNPAGRPSVGSSMGMPVIPVRGANPGVGCPADGGAGSAIGGGTGGKLSASIALRRSGCESRDGESPDWESVRDYFPMYQ